MIIASNKKAFHDYFIENKYEAGIVLAGSEVKSIRAGHVSIKECYVRIKNGELIILNMYVKNYEYSKTFMLEERRTRKLLMHKREISKLNEKVTQAGYTLVPLNIYLKNGLVKLEVGLAKGKQLHDKRDAIAKKDAQRDIERAFKEKNNIR